MKNIFVSSNRRMLFILFTMFLNFLGFSIIIPILPFLVQQYVSPTDVAFYVGTLLSVYALCQFFASPGLGALSDYVGRRPILLISLLGSVIGYIILGIGGAMWVLFLGRIIDGLTGGNISTVYAYIADITEPKDRGKTYGLIGAAGGFGFMIGPALGGLLATISIPTPLFVAAGITFLNLLWGYFVLPESLLQEHKSKTINLTHLNPFAQFSHIFSFAILRRIFVASFLFFLALYALYGNASVYMKDVLGWNATEIGLLLFIVGIVDIITQGMIVRKLLPIFGEIKVASLGLFLTIGGFVIAALITVFPSPFLLYVGVIIINIGDGLFEPSQNTLISNTVDRKMMGRVQGANQGMQAIARVFGPLFAAYTYPVWRGLPYASGALLILGGLIIFFISRSIISSHKAESISA